MNISYQNLKTLKGIKGFLEAEEVWCHNNQLTQLNLPKAERVYCYNNQLTQLTIPEAERVDCDNNQLTQLNLPKAERVYCHNNQLTQLTIPEAEEVDCSNNQLTQLNLPKAERVYCHNNPNLIFNDIKVPKDCSIAYFNRHLIPYQLAYKLYNNKITFKEILEISNTEHRMVALSVYSPEKLLKEVNAEEIDRNERGDILYEVKGEKVGLSSNFKLGTYRDYSTDRLYVDFMRPECKTIDEALSKRHHFTLDEWIKCKHA